MSKKTQQSPEESSAPETSRRALLKRALLVLGASAIAQASGGVMTLQATPKKEGSKVDKNAKTTHKSVAKTTVKSTAQTTNNSNVEKQDYVKKVGKKKKLGDATLKKDG